MNPVVFLDRDGTVITEPEDQQVDSLQKLRFVPGVISGLRRLTEAGYRLVMVTNQDHLGTPQYPQMAFDEVQTKMLEVFQGEGVAFDRVFICPHGPNDGCACRKPRTGMVDAYLKENTPDRERSFMIGDRETDVAFGKAIGVRTIRLLSDPSHKSDADVRVASFDNAVEAILVTPRRSHVHRKTTETDVTIDITLEGTGRLDVRTGLGFFDHMLTLLLRHASFDGAVIANGDLHVDEHHTIEDTGLALGDAIRQALGEKRGVGRYGFVVPMDEAEAKVSLDLSGRPFVVFTVPFTRERIGDVPTELFEDFFRAFADGLRATLHISANGRNEHHSIEACFKAVGRTLQDAVAVNPRTRDIIPSTKGVL